MLLILTIADCIADYLLYRYTGRGETYIFPVCWLCIRLPNDCVVGRRTRLSRKQQEERTGTTISFHKQVHIYDSKTEV